MSFADRRANPWRQVASARYRRLARNCQGWRTAGPRPYDTTNLIAIDRANIAFSELLATLGIPVHAHRLFGRRKGQFCGRFFKGLLVVVRSTGWPEKYPNQQIAMLWAKDPEVVFRLAAAGQTGRPPGRISPRS